MLEQPLVVVDQESLLCCANECFIHDYFIHQRQTQASTQKAQMHTETQGVLSKEEKKVSVEPTDPSENYPPLLSPIATVHNPSATVHSPDLANDVSGNGRPTVAEISSNPLGVTQLFAEALHSKSVILFLLLT